MSPDEAPFLAAICAAPDHDSPRLVYADWLDEHARVERAEFIRLQCEHARPQVLERERDLNERIQILATAKPRSKVLGLDNLLRVQALGIESAWPHATLGITVKFHHNSFENVLFFRRGFVYQAHTSTYTWCHELQHILTAHHPVEKVHLAVRGGSRMINSLPSVNKLRKKFPKLIFVTGWRERTPST